MLINLKQFHKMVDAMRDEGYVIKTGANKLKKHIANKAATQPIPKYLQEANKDQQISSICNEFNLPDDVFEGCLHADGTLDVNKLALLLKTPPAPPRRSRPQNVRRSI